MDDGLCDLALVKMHHTVNMFPFFFKLGISAPQSRSILPGLGLGHYSVYLI